MCMSLTVQIPEAAEMLGIARNSAYKEARDTGQLAGISVIKVGRRLVLPRAPLMRALGMEDTEHNEPAAAR